LYTPGVSVVRLVCTKLYEEERLSGRAESGGKVYEEAQEVSWKTNRQGAGMTSTRTEEMREREKKKRRCLLD
jgi:hypothetical protein